MSRFAKVIPIVGPVAAVAVAAVAGLVASWAAQGRWPALVTAAPIVAARQMPPGPALDTTTVIAVPVAAEPAPEPEAAAMPEAEPEPVDYSRLNTDVRVVADTLERFNQKLLRMIAQVRAEQIREEAAAMMKVPVEPKPAEPIDAEPQEDEPAPPRPVAIPAASAEPPAESEPTL